MSHHDDPTPPAAPVPDGQGILALLLLGLLVLLLLVAIIAIAQAS